MVGVITAGGQGTRLSSIAVDIPKPMVKVLEKPIIEYQIDCLRNSGIDLVYIIVGHLGHVIKDYFKDGKDFGVRIKYIEESYPLGSAGGLFYLKEILHDDFIFLFGDLILDVDFKRMIEFHKINNASITLFAHPNSHPFDSDLVLINENNLVVGIDSKNNKRDYFYHNLVNAGVYIVSTRIFKDYYFELGKKDFEKDILAQELKKLDVFAYCSSEYVKDAGTPDRYYSVCEDVKNGVVYQKNLRNPQKCVFFDRDGTINEYVGFLRNIDDFKLIDGVADSIKQLNTSSYLVIVISNQPVIARGEVSFKQLDQIHNKMETLLGRQGAYIDHIFYCPHHPDKGYDGEIAKLKIDCDCRKPKIGLLVKAKEKFNLDFSQCFFVGDTTTDIQTGINAGVKTILVKTGEKGMDGKYNNSPDYVINDLREIKRIIKGE